MFYQHISRRKRNGYVGCIVPKPLRRLFIVLESACFCHIPPDCLTPARGLPLKPGAFVPGGFLQPQSLGQMVAAPMATGRVKIPNRRCNRQDLFSGLTMNLGDMPAIPREVLGGARPLKRLRHPRPGSLPMSDSITPRQPLG